MSASMTAQDTGQAQVQLDDYWRILRSRWTTILLAGLVGLGLAAVYGGASPPTYEATSTVLLRPLTSDPLQQLDAGSRAIEPATERQIALSLTTATRAKELLGTNATPEQLLEQAEVEITADADILRFVFTSPDAQRSADTVDAFAQSYLAYRNGRARDSVAAVRSNLENRLTAVLEDQAAVAEEIDALEAEGDDEAASEARIQVSVLQSRQVLVEDELAGVSTTGLSGGEVISPAIVPDSPSGLGLPVLLVVGLGLGAIIGIVWAFVRHNLDPTVHDADMAQSLLGVPILGLVEDRHPRRRRLRWDATIAPAMRRAAATLDSLWPTDQHHPVVVLAIGDDDQVDAPARALADGLARHCRAVVIDRGGSGGVDAPTTVFDQVEARSRPGAERPDYVEVADGNHADVARIDGSGTSDGRVRPPAAALVELLPHYDVVVVAAPSLDQDTLALDVADFPGARILPVVRVGHTRQDQLIHARRDLTTASATVPGVVVVGPRRTWGRTIADGNARPGAAGTPAERALGEAHATVPRAT